MKFNPLGKKFDELDRRQSISEANNDFNIRRIDGVDYIVYKNVRITEKGEQNLVEKIASLREMYLEDRLQ